MPAASYLTVNCKQSDTPLYHQKSALRSRQLCQKENPGSESYHGHWAEYPNPGEEKWDRIESPQFIDFSNIPETHDTFFDHTVIMSTPNPTAPIKKYTFGFSDAALAQSLTKCSISNNNKESTEEVDNVTLIEEDSGSRHEHNEQTVLENIPEAPIAKEPITKVKPFRLDLRDKDKDINQNNKIPQENPKPKVFKANPLPKYLKPRSVSTASQVPNLDKEQAANSTAKPHKSEKKRVEVWNKKPFIPQRSTKIPERPKTPPLATAMRAKERQRFEDALKEKKRQQELHKQMEEHARKKREEEEVAQLRKLTVHKAQPIRKYKFILPVIEKRPLTEPISPRVLKRRRFA